MIYALAHDEDGIPLEIPSGTNGWLVRRHSGGRGRPAAVYDPDGRPLVVDLDATVTDLRNAGCKPGTYRLDAVDGQRKLLGAAAYTELQGGADAGDAEGSAAPDAAVMALARAVEAMQRVQAERERVQAEMFGKLIERLAPPAPVVPRNLIDTLGEYTDAQKIIRKLAPESEDDDRADESSTGSSRLASVLEQVAVAVLAIPAVQEKLGMRPSADADEPDESDEQVDEAAVAPEKAEEGTAKASKDVEQKLETVMELLTPDEAEHVRRMSQKLPPLVLQKALKQLVALSPEDAVVEIRKLMGKPPTTKPKSARSKSAKTTTTTATATPPTTKKDAA